ncbi:MAG: proline--tRNA ligase [Kiritimatiellae bacterium]|jgi:prolyl-tRNA synthetase|nr:proline--tRNA ligase [Kiritimatiellia bacterium]
MKWTNTVVPTLRDNPQEAEIPSHQLMLRAGLLRKLAGGLYTFMPLGFKALRKVEQIVREEMDAAGALEVLMPALQPKEIWEQSGRYEKMSKAMYSVIDRQGREMELGPTHEEVITDLVSREISSYKQMPVTFYQIQTKFRDEIRPRFGLMRAKEFIMKDAYSFDASWDEADSSYQKMYDAYIRIFERCGLVVKPVEADAGDMGGNWSHEFMVLADSGEDGIVECSACSYAANSERATFKYVEAKQYDDAEKNLEEVHTPAAKTIKEVAEFLKCEERRLIKTLIYTADDKPVAVLLPGDREINETKLGHLLDANEFKLADDASVETVTGAAVGFAGPIGLDVPIYADVSLKGVAGAYTGANKTDYHYSNVNLERDANVEKYEDLCLATSGDSCPECGAALNECRGIEVGHVFKLGDKYCKSFNAKFLDQNGKEQVITMGCYGIGVTRTLQAIIEQSHDENGIIWPMSVAPYVVDIVVVNPKHEESMTLALQLEKQLEADGIDTIVDDRKDRAGVKFKDADLLGFPIRVVIGQRSLDNGNVELKIRNQEDSKLIEVDKILLKLKEIYRS